MIEEKTKAIECEAEFLDETLGLAREVVVLRGRLAAARREHAELSEQREQSLAEGIDVLPEIRLLFLEIEALPAQIAQVEQRARYLATSFVEGCNNECNRRASAIYIVNRDALRSAAKQFHSALASVTEGMQRGGFEGAVFIKNINARLAAIESLLNCGALARAVFRLNPLPAIDVDAVARGQLLSALDRWVAGLG